MASNTLTLTRPDDWHLHLRDGPMLARTVADTARCFARAIVMPNLVPPVTTVAAAADYRQRILAAAPEGSEFEPLMTLYLTERTTAEEIRTAADSGYVHAVKYYPAGATTNSESGVTDFRRAYPVFEAMQACDLPLLLHGEVTDGDVDVFDREAVFIEAHLQPLVNDFPALRTVLEHVTTAEGVEFVRSAGPKVAGTITVHHLMLNRNDLFKGGLRPHHYCLPLAKREHHRAALLGAATGGDPSFFLGTDSAPHARSAKESACGCAGIYTAPNALELYAEVFEAADALQRLEAFASFHGPDFYGLPRNTGQLTLERRPWTVPPVVDGGGEPVVPFRADGEVAWRLVNP